MRGLTTVSALKQLSGALIDVHGQHDSIILQNPELHIGYIDAFGDTGAELLAYRESYKALKETERAIKKISMDDSDKEARIDLLKYQIGEIEAAAVEDGEAAAVLWTSLKPS